MALVIENGSIVENANSYCTVSETKAYLLDRGINTLLSDEVIESYLVKASDYIETIPNFKGDKVSIDQSLNWPRTNAFVGITQIPVDSIPTKIKRAQMQLVLHQIEGVDINPVTTGNFIVKEKIGPIETQYSEKLNTDITPTLPMVDALLLDLISILKSNSKGFGFATVVRV